MNKKSISLLLATTIFTTGIGSSVVFATDTNNLDKDIQSTLNIVDETIKAIENMEKEKTGVLIDEAYQLWTKLSNDENKSKLYKRIEAVAGPHHKEVYDAVGVARNSKDITDVAKARDKVSGLANLFLNDKYTWSSELDIYTIEHQVVVVDTLNGIASKKEEIEQAKINKLQEIIVGLELQRSNKGLLKLVLDYSATLDKVQMDYASEVVAMVEKATTVEEIEAAKAKYDDLMTMTNEALKSALQADLGVKLTAKEEEINEEENKPVLPTPSNNKAPEISIMQRTVELKQGTEWNLKLHTVLAWDEEDGNISQDKIKVTNNIDVNVPNTYTVTLEVTDSAGATTTEYLTVIINAKIEKQEIKFTDSQVEKAIRTQIKKGTGAIYDKDVEYITQLRMYDMNVTTLADLKYLPNLEVLTVTNAPLLSDISVLASLKNMKELNIIGCGVTSIKTLEELTKIESLNLTNNNIEDISSLSKLTKMESLDLSENSIQDISSIKNMTNITTLILNDNKITVIEAVKNLTNLQIIGMANNTIKDLSAIQGLTKLKQAILIGSEINNVDVFKNLTNLDILMISKSKISESDLAILKEYLPNTNIRAFN